MDKYTNIYTYLYTTHVYICSWYDHVTGHRHAALALAHDLRRRLLPILHAWYRYTSEERRNRSVMCMYISIIGVQW